MMNAQYLRSVSLRRDTVDDFDRYPFHLPAVRHLDNLLFHPKVTYIIGENGSGKSTLMEALALGLGLNPEGGSRNMGFSTRATHSVLGDHLRIAKGIKRPHDQFFLRAEGFYNLATEIERLDDAPGGPKIVDSFGGTSLHLRSHGEAFLTLMLERLRGNSVYLFDEPEAALSPQRQLTALARIHQLVLEGSQFVIATHSPILMAYPDSLIYEVDQHGIQVTTFDEVEHVQTMKDFLANPKRMLNILFGQ